jgi:hypothetical protein
MKVSVIDKHGAPLDEILVNQEVLIQGQYKTTRRKNGSSHIVLIKDENGFTVELAWVDIFLAVTLSQVQEIC